MKMKNYKLLVIDKCESTQDEVKKLVARNPEQFIAVLALEQSKGRGNYGRTWISEKGGLFLSFNYPLLKFNLPPSIVFSVLVVKSLANLLENVGLIYPNDIVLKHEGLYYKLGGVLVEIFKNFYIIGIGLNVNNSVIHYELEHRAISLKEFFAFYKNENKEFDIKEIAENIIQNLEKNDFNGIYDDLLKFDFSSQLENIELVAILDIEIKDKFDRIKVNYQENKIVLYKGRMRKEIEFEKLIRIMY